jgi:hypothetical protein
MDGPPDVGRNQYAARGRHGLETSGDIDPVSKKVPGGRHPHFAQMDPGPDGRLGLRRQGFSRLNRAADLTELQHEAIASGIEDAASMCAGNVCDQRANGGHIGHGAHCVGISASREAGHVDGHDRRQPAPPTIVRQRAA